MVLSSLLPLVLLPGLLWPQVPAPANAAQHGRTPEVAGRERKIFGISVHNVAVQRDPDGLVVEITSTGSLVPSITRLDGPPRLVIDLVGAVNAVQRGKIPVHENEVKSVRINQYQQMPPITRVVVDLVEPRGYAWEALENKIAVHLHPLEGAEKKPEELVPSAPAFTEGVQPAITSDSGGTGTVALAGSHIAAGSSITAGVETAVLNLARGGEVHVCPGTTVSLTMSQNGRDLMLGMSTGAVEAHYKLSTSADSVLTPDFRVLFPGPGEFHYAVSADSRGNTCVRALPGNTASAMISELMGDGTYQVKPNDQVVFHSGQLSKVDNAVPIDCGCPEPHAPVMRAESAPPPARVEVSTEDPGSKSNPPDQGEAAKVVPPAVALPAEPPNQVLPQESAAVTPPATAPAPATNADDLHVQVEAPLVYRANVPPPAPTEEVGHMPAVAASRAMSLATAPLPPKPEAQPAQEKPQPKPHKSFFGRVKGFFHAMFG